MKGSKNTGTPRINVINPRAFSVLLMIAMEIFRYKKAEKNVLISSAWVWSQNSLVPFT